jgi:hypothetical protein
MVQMTHKLVDLSLVLLALNLIFVPPSAFANAGVVE